MFCISSVGVYTVCMDLQWICNVKNSLDHYCSPKLQGKVWSIRGRAKAVQARACITNLDAPMPRSSSSGRRRRVSLASLSVINQFRSPRTWQRFVCSASTCSGVVGTLTSARGNSAPLRSRAGRSRGELRKRRKKYLCEYLCRRV